jgi:thioredoxin-dependent peroxiredoxin
MGLEIGAAAPEFVLPSTGGETISLAALRGKKIVLYFYPADDTPTCTKQACEFRTEAAEIGAADAVILGVSPDGIASHEKFRRKFKLPFVLLADEGHAVAEKYGVWVKKSMFGHKYMGIERTTFVIDRQGKIAAIFRKVRVKGHVAAVRAALQAAK